MSFRNSILFQIVLIASLSACSKNPKIGSDQQSSFIKLFGGSTFDVGSGVVECTDEGYAITGTMMTPNHLSQAFLIRTDKYGNEVSWSPLFIGNSLNSKGTQILLTSDNNFLVTGTVALGANNYNVMVSKISATGSILWYKTFGGTSDDEGLCSIELSNGNYLIGGYTSSSPYNSFGGKDDWILDLDVNGNLIWQKNYGTPQNDQCNQLLKFGNDIILIGTTYGYQSTDSIPNIYLVTIDPSNPNIPLAGQNYGGAIKTMGMNGVVTVDSTIIIMSNQHTTDSSRINMIGLSGTIYNLIWKRNLTSSQNEWGYDLIFNQTQLIALGSVQTPSDTDFLIQPVDLKANSLQEEAIVSMGDQIIYSGIVSKDNHLVYTGQNKVNGLSEVVLVKTDLPK